MRFLYMLQRVHGCGLQKRRANVIESLRKKRVPKYFKADVCAGPECEEIEGDRRCQGNHAFATPRTPGITLLGAMQPWRIA